MVEITEIDLPSLSWQPGYRGRIWYGQPAVSLSHKAPFLPVITGTTSNAFTVLRAVCAKELNLEPPAQAPSFVLLPELSLHPTELLPALDLIERARTNTVFAFGMGHLAEKEARNLEPDTDLWIGPSAGRFTNCAGIALGGERRLFLQPKIVPSQWEYSDHWRGNVIRHFIGSFFSFVVLICSELLEQPGNASTLSTLITSVRRRGRSLNLLIWLQHNQKPRSTAFSQSIDSLRDLDRPTILIASSRAERPLRLENYAVSGAILPNETLPSNLRTLTKHFHYVEPIAATDLMSRVVLLRYDADAYLATTTLADAIRPGAHAVAKGSIFESSDPYILAEDQLITSTDPVHLTDLTAPALRRALNEFTTYSHVLLRLASRDDYIEAVGRIGVRLTGLETFDFIGFLDVAILPRPLEQALRHAPSVSHEGGDFRCRCWEHRRCIDSLEDQHEPLATVIAHIAALELSGISVQPLYNPDLQANIRIHIGDIVAEVGIVFPFDRDAAGVREGLFGGKTRPSLRDSRFIILGTQEVGRPPIGTIDAAMPMPIGLPRQGVSAAPTMAAVFFREFWDAAGDGSLPNRLRDLSKHAS